jgi:drug/metabolite transporter (DMT)-like permease
MSAPRLHRAPPLPETHRATRRPLRAAAWMIGAQLLFALMAAGTRVCGRHVPWQEVCASRFVVGAITAYVAARIGGESLRIARVGEAWLRSVFGTVSAAGTFFLYASPALALGDVTTLLATAPLFVAMLSAPVLGERIHKSVALALACGFAGIALVARPSFSSAGHLVAIGAATAITSAIAHVSLRRIGPSESSEAIVFHFACVGSTVMVLACIPVWRTPSPADGLVLGITGLFGGLGQLALTRAYTADHAAPVSALGYSGVVFSRAIAAPLFREIPSVTQALGSLFVIASGIALAFGKAAFDRLRRGGVRASPRSR